MLVIMVEAAARLNSQTCLGVTLANIVTATGGVDLSYPFRTMGGAGRNAQPEIGEYYLNPAGQGEPPGRWAGRGLDKFGLAAGGQVDEKVFKSIYSGKDPATGKQLGRRAPSHTKFDDHLARLMAAEPHATAERVEELKREAAQATRSSSAYVDVTNDWSKSISIAHASIRQNLYHAKLTGDAAGVEYWTAQEALFSDALQRANAAGMAYLQSHAGYTRVGQHARREGKDTGKFKKADLVIGSFLQGTNREGEMHDHEHNLVWSKTFTQGDGKVRALDTMALRAQLPAIQAVLAAATESELTRTFGFGWVDRPDGRGREIVGVSQEEMDQFSVRGQVVNEAVRSKAAQWERDKGGPPTEAQLRYMRDAAWYGTRKGKEKGELDWDEHTRRWDRVSGGALASIFPRVSGQAGQAGSELSRREQREAMAAALDRVQQRSSTFSRAQLMKEIAACAPTMGMEPDRAVALVEELTDRALSGEGGHVINTEAPEFPALPHQLQREEDGRSIYTRPGSQRYSTGAQLSLEHRLVKAARKTGAPALSRVRLAEALGSTQEALAAALRAQAHESREVLPSGLRLDQAAALYHVLTTGRTAEVLCGPGGSGKSHCAAFAAKAWKELTGQDVIGVTPSQASRNVLREMGMEAYNFADFLGHTKEKRNKRGAYEIAPGTLLILDESSMFSTPDMTDILEYAARSGARVLVMGDHGQLQAVESGGGMMLLATEGEYVQLATPVRFSQEWERDATLQLRAGNADVLHEYEEHGRLRGGDKQGVMDNARHDYVAGYLQGQDVLLMAKSNKLCAELSMAIRDDLIHLGYVSPGKAEELDGGGWFSAGDLLINTQNDYDAEVELANGDVVRVVSVSGDKVTVAKLIGSQNGDREFGPQFSYPLKRVVESFELGYAVTFHSAQGRTVDSGQAIITGSEDRQSVYVGMSRGRNANTAYVMTEARVAQPEKGAAPSVSVDRYDRQQKERSAIPKSEPTDKELEARQEEEADGRIRDRIAVMSDALDRDGTQESAIRSERRELSLADHLGVLNVILFEETRPVQTERYAALVREVMPDELKDRQSYTATWLYRTLRFAEAAGMDAKEVLHRAIEGRTFDGLKDPVAGLKSWIEKDNGALVPQPRTGWSGTFEKTGDRERDEYLEKVATAMDERRERLGPYLAQAQPLYAIHALGPVPEEPEARGEWEEKARAVETYREISGYCNEVDAIGPEPVNSPENRQLWHTAFAALGPRDGFDVRALSDGALLNLRKSYERETAWAPRHVSRELSAARVSMAEHETKVIRAEAEVASARERGDLETAQRHDDAA